MMNVSQYDLQPSCPNSCQTFFFPTSKDVPFLLCPSVPEWPLLICKKERKKDISALWFLDKCAPSALSVLNVHMQSPYRHGSGLTPETVLQPIIKCACHAMAKHLL